MAKMGRPKGSRARAPKARTATARILRAFDATDEAGRHLHHSTGDVARAARANQQLVIRALDRWRPDWRARFWPSQALADRAREEE